MKKDAIKAEKATSHFESYEELKSSCPENTQFVGPIGADGSLLTVNGQSEASCMLPNGTKHGNFIRWHKNGKKAVKGSYLNGKKSGEWTYWYENNQMSGKGNFTDDQPNGKWLTWYDNGQLESEGEYQKGSQKGEFKYLDKKGSLTKTLIYEDGELRKTILYRDGKPID